MLTIDAHRDPDSPLISPEVLLAGPRGRRMLLQFALASAPATAVEPRSLSEATELAQAVFWAAHRLSEGSRGSASFGWNLDSRVVATPETVADALERVALYEVTAEGMRQALIRSVDAARYWQAPDDDDQLASSPPVHAALARVAAHVCASPVAQWLIQGADVDAQWRVEWPTVTARENESRERDRSANAAALAARPALAAQHASLIAEEGVWSARRAEHPNIEISGEWWSTPSSALTQTSGTMHDGSPSGLWFVEDSFGEAEASTRAMRAAGDVRVLEIESARTWAALCRGYPIEVTHQRHDDWRQTTGRTGRWVQPDWAALADEYDVVHLQPIAYLEAAGAVIQIDAERASVIAGWNPDASYWLTGKALALDEQERWKRRYPAETSIGADDTWWHFMWERVPHMGAGTEAH